MGKLVLASSSRYRAELLERLGLAFESRPPDVDETRLPDEAPEDLVARLSAAKARALAPQLPDALIIGSDQVAVLGSDVLGKPGSPARAREQLTRLSGRSVRFLTGVCLLEAATAQEQVAVVPTEVKFRALHEAEIARYVDREQPLDCAGAFKSEGLGITLFEAIRGDDPNALIGLPLIELSRMLRRVGLELP